MEYVCAISLFMYRDTFKHYRQHHDFEISLKIHCMAFVNFEIADEIISPKPHQLISTRLSE
jgi:hypothetical protein